MRFLYRKKAAGDSDVCERAVKKVATCYASHRSERLSIAVLYRQNTNTPTSLMEEPHCTRVLYQL